MTEQTKRLHKKFAPNFKESLSALLLQFSILVILPSNLL